jgi:hypothetical protein
VDKLIKGVEMKYRGELTMENEERATTAAYEWKGSIEVAAWNAQQAEKIVKDLLEANGIGWPEDENDGGVINILTTRVELY